MEQNVNINGSLIWFWLDSFYVRDNTMTLISMEQMLIFFQLFVIS